MSNKPMKRGDQRSLEEKMKRKSRKTETISPIPPLTMIFCEGIKTETNYLSEIVDRINEKHRDYVMSSRISLRDVIEIRGIGRGTTSLLEQALKFIDKSTERVWLVYDRDSFPSEQFNEVPKRVKALSQRGKVEYRVAWTNECFGLWLLLHFRMHEASSQCKYYSDELSKLLPGYRKSASNIYSLLEDRVSTAINNARILESRYESNSSTRS